MKTSTRLRKIVLALAASATLAPLGGAAVVLDWSDWSSSFDDGRRGWQSFTNSDGVQIRYRNNRIRTRFTPRADFVFGTPAVLSAANGGGAFPPFNGTGGAADNYLDIYQNAGLGNGTRHRFQFDQALDGASIEIWDIDSAIGGGRNFTDQVRVVALDANGQEVAPTRAIVTNSSVVLQADIDTWRGAEDVAAASNSTDGNLVVFFDMAGITEIRVDYTNYDYGNAGGPISDSQAIGIYNITETGLVVPPVVPEPSSVVLALFGGLLALRRRR